MRVRNGTGDERPDPQRHSTTFRIHRTSQIAQRTEPSFKPLQSSAVTRLGSVATISRNLAKSQNFRAVSQHVDRGDGCAKRIVL